jgi:hypothetical protein
MVTTANDEAKVWKFQNGLIIEANSIPADEPTDLNQHPMSCSSTNASTVVVHRGKLVFTVYLCEGCDVTKKDEINLVKEVVANGNPGFSWTQADRVTDLRMVEEDSILRVDFTKDKEHF